MRREDKNIKNNSSARSGSFWCGQKLTVGRKRLTIGQAEEQRQKNEEAQAPNDP